MWLRHRHQRHQRHRLHENSQNLGDEKPQRVRRNPNDDHPSAKKSIKPVRKRDDNVLPPTKR